MRIYVNGAQALAFNPPAAKAAVWHSNSQMALRLGGTALGGSRADTVWPSASGIAGNRGFDGWLDEVAIYSGALDAAAIAAHYNAKASSGAYETAILADSPLGYWNMNEAAYPAPASSSFPIAVNSGSEGSAANGTNWWGVLANQAGPDYAGFGAGNRACFFNGTSGYLAVPTNANLNFAGNITLMAWVKPQVKDHIRDIIAQGWVGGPGYSGASYKEVFLRISRGYENGGYGLTNYYEIGAGNEDPSFENASALAVIPEGDIGNWVFIAGTYDGANWNLYRNGELVSTAPGAYGALNLGNRWTIGAKSNPIDENPGGDGAFFGGSIDEPAIFNTALSATDISNIYQSALVKPVITRSIATPDGYLKSSWPTLFKGGSAMLSVWAEGLPTLAYQWYSNGVPLGVTATNLLLSNLPVSTPTYSVVVTNLYGAATSSVTLTIIATAPTFTQQPVPLARFAGTPFSFSITTGGSTPQSNQWQTNLVNISGATSTTYNGIASLANAFNYSCTVSNEVGITNSAAAALAVFPAAFGYGAAALGSSPIAYWRLGETNGSLAYDYIGNNNGTYFNPTLNQPGYSALDPDRAAGFGAPDNYVGQINGTAINFEGTNASFTLECWVNGPAGQSDQSAIICKGTSDSGTIANEQFALDIAFGYYRLMTRGNGAVIYSAVANVGPNGTWQHVVGVYDQSNPAAPEMRIYVNGVEAGSGPGRPPANNGLRASTSDISIGAKRLGNSPTYDGYFTGTIDEVAIYNTALSASTIEAHYGAAYGDALAPQIVLQPISVTNYLGLSATFTVGAAGTVPLTYQWNKAGSGPVGGNDSFLTLKPLSAADEGTYSVKISNPVLPGGTNSASVYLRVLPTPTAPPAIPGLVMLHRFENNLTDSTGRGNNGTAKAVFYTGSVLTTNNSATPQFVSGPPGRGNAYHYQSDFGPVTTPGATTTTNTEYVSLGVLPADLRFSSNINFSVAMWVKQPFAFQGGDLPFFTSTEGALGGQGFVFSPAYGYGNGGGLNPNPAPLNYGAWGMSLYDVGSVNGSRIYGDITEGSLNDGLWHHLVYVLDRNNKQAVVYFDGLPAKAYKISGNLTGAAKTIDTNAPVSIGQDPTGKYAETGSGDIDDLAVWTRALTPLEAGSVYTAATAGFGPAYVPPPIIGTQPTSIVALAGTATNLMVVVTSTSTGVTNYQWQRNQNDLPGKTSATLSFPSLAIGDYGDYRVKVDDGGLIVYSTTVTVRPPASALVVNTPPASKAVPAGLKTSLSVVASSGSGATNYQWQFYGTNAATANYGGTKSNTLTIVSMSAAKVGPYDVVVNDGYNFATSTVANLTLAQQPTVTNALSGSTLSLTFATEVGPQYVLEWKSDLTNAAWLGVITNNGSGSPITIPTSTSPDPQRFYRVRMQ